MAKTQGKELRAVNIRLSEEDAERFKRMALEKNKSQSELLVELMDLSMGKMESSETVVDGGCIQLGLLKKNNFRRDTEKYPEIPARKYQFKGTVIYTQQGFFTTPAVYVAAKLEREFGIQENLGNYTFGHSLKVFYDEDVKKYLVLEEMSVFQPGEMQPPRLWVSRCRHVSDVAEIREKFSTYAAEQNFVNIEWAMAENIGTQTDIFEEYF